MYAMGGQNTSSSIESLHTGFKPLSAENKCKRRFTLHNFCLKLSHATCLQLELYCVNQAHNLPTLSALRIPFHLSEEETHNAHCLQTNAFYKYYISRTKSISDLTSGAHVETCQGAMIQFF
jgi:hypothetical protein